MQGMWSTGVEAAGLPGRLGDLLARVILPGFCLSYAQLAFLTRFTRANVLESLDSDFVRAARARGLSETVVLRRHPRAAALPASLIGQVLYR